MAENIKNAPNEGQSSRAQGQASNSAPRREPVQNRDGGSRRQNAPNRGRNGQGRGVGEEGGEANRRAGNAQGGRQPRGHRGQNVQARQNSQGGERRNGGYRPERRTGDRPESYRGSERASGKAQHEVQAAETFEDIRRDNDRIEKEIWLEIADIHTIKFD